MLLAGGLYPANVAEAIATAAPWGVDVNSGVRGADGFKDPALLERFIAMAKGWGPPADEHRSAAAPRAGG